MKSLENNLNNNNEQNEKLNQNPESQESLESAEDMQKRLSQEITNKNEELKQENTKIETANNSIGLSNEEVAEEKTAMNLDSEISSIDSEADKLTNESQQELNSETPSKTVERPPIPPLSPKNVENPPEPTEQAETPTAEAPQEVAPESAKETVDSGETAEDDPKQKAFNEIRARHDADMEKKANDPENPLNKISAALIKDKQAFDKIVNQAGYDGLDRYIVMYAGVQQDSLEKALPDMLDKGMISPEAYASYLALTSYKGNSLDMPRLNRLIAETPAIILNKLADEGGVFTGVLNEWYEKTQTEIEKEKGLPISDTEKVLKLVSSVGRFGKEEEASESVSSAVDTYMKSHSNIARLRQEDGSYPVLENLYEASFSDQADKILEKGFSDGSIYGKTILEYQKKGYITEQKAKDMYEKRGLLK